MNTLYCPTCNIHIDSHEAGNCLDRWMSKLLYGVDYMVARYSRDIADTWQVKGKLRELGWAIKLFCDELGTQITLYNYATENEIYAEAWQGDSLAICRAYIKAMT